MHAAWHKIVANATDGQWSKLTTRSSDGEPLTHLQYQKDVWQKCSKYNKATLLQTLNGYSIVSEQVTEDVSMAHLNIGGKFISGNINVSVESNVEGHKCVHVSSVGHEDYKIPMVRNITSTKVPCAWKKNEATEKYTG